MRFLDFITQVKPSYRCDWYHGRMIELIEQAVSEGLDVLCSAPPGFGKTELFSILLPSWLIAADAVTTSQRILDDNKRKLSEFDHAGLAEFLATEKILATVNL